MKKGFKHSEESKKKVSEAHKGIKFTEEHKRKISISRKNRKTKLGYLISPETRKKLSEINKGKKHSEETKRKISESEKGKILSKITKQKMSEAKRGEKHHNWKGGYNELKKRLKTNLKYQLNSRISTSIRISLKGNKNGRHWESLVGYTYIQLKKRLKLTMPKGYTWKNYINGELQIDHIIPISFFEFSKPEDLGFKKCWELSNLRLLSKKENFKKHNKLIKTLQLNLMI